MHTAQRGKWIGVVFATVIGGSSMLACSSAEPDDAVKGTEVSFDASAASRSELGVDSWMGTTSDQQSTVRGVDAKGKTVVSMDARSFDESGIHHVRQQVTHAGKSATFDLQTKTLNGEPAVRLEATLATGASPLRRALELLLDDATSASGKATAPTLTVRSTAALGLRDEPLVTSQCSLLRKCDNKELLKVTSAVKAGLVCTGEALVAVDGWKILGDILGGDGVTESLKNGVETSDCLNDFGEAWKNNTPGGQLDFACEHTGADGCPLPRETPCFPGCRSGFVCEDDGVHGPQCQIAPQK